MDAYDELDRERQESRAETVPLMLGRAIFGGYFLAVVIGIGSTVVAFALSMRDTRRAFRKTIGGVPVSPLDRGDGDQTGSHSAS